MNFYIQRNDGRWYAGTVDRKAMWVDYKRFAAPFRAKEHAERRMGGLPDDAEYQVQR